MLLRASPSLLSPLSPLLPVYTAEIHASAVLLPSAAGAAPVEAATAETGSESEAEAAAEAAAECDVWEGRENSPRADGTNEEEGREEEEVEKEKEKVDGEAAEEAAEEDEDEEEEEEEEERESSSRPNATLSRATRWNAARHPGSPSKARPARADAATAPSSKPMWEDAWKTPKAAPLLCSGMLEEGRPSLAPLPAAAAAAAKVAAVSLDGCDLFPELC
ncbi:unnamed protein product [Closterium sp. NIES-54]